MSSAQRRIAKVSFITKAVLVSALIAAPLAEVYAQPPVHHHIRSQNRVSMHMDRFSMVQDTSRQCGLANVLFNVARNEMSDAQFKGYPVIKGIAGMLTSSVMGRETRLKALNSALKDNNNFFSSMSKSSYEASMKETKGTWGFSLSENGVKVTLRGKDSLEFGMGRNIPGAIMEAMINPDFMDLMHSSALIVGHTFISARVTVKDGRLGMPRDHIIFCLPSTYPGTDEGRIGGVSIRLPLDWEAISRRHLLFSETDREFGPVVYVRIKNKATGESAELLIMASSNFKPGEKLPLKMFMAKNGVVEEYK
jgi:hypothetical protein